MEGRLLVVDHDPGVRAALGRLLSYEGFEVSSASDLSGALAEMRLDPPDLLLMEAHLPDGDGVEVCRRLRDDGARVPIVIVTERDRVADRVAVLDAGADDFVVKPYSAAELVARVRALLRRHRDLSGGTVSRFGDVLLDRSTREVRRGGRRIELTRREFDLLALLMAHGGAVLSRGRILDEAWGAEAGVETGTVDVYVGYLRRKLEAAGGARLIHTVRGVGYGMRLPPAEGA